MSRITIVALVLVPLVASCSMGPKLETWPPATGPAGVEVTVPSGERSVTGELLAVRDSVLILAIHRPAPDSAGYPRLAKVPAPRSWSPREMERHRLLSRYPQGLSPELEARLASAYDMRSIPWLP